MKNKAIKKGYVCQFHKDCVKCSMKNLCISASGLVSGDRRYFLRNKGYREPTTEAMTKGKELHEKYQKGMKSALKTPFHIIRKELFSGMELVYSEFQLCSPLYGLRGIIDVLKIQYDRTNKVMNLTGVELKSHYWKPYFKQIACYGLILSDLKHRFVQEVTKRKTRRITHKFYPNEEFRLNINLRLQVFEKKPIDIPWVKNNQMTDYANGISAYVLRRAKELRVYHKLGLHWLEEIPECENCNPEFCGFYQRFCSKIPKVKEKVKTKQRYWGKKKLLIKTKPKINMAEISNMVRIK